MKTSSDAPLRHNTRGWAFVLFIFSQIQAPNTTPCLRLPPSSAMPTNEMKTSSDALGGKPFGGFGCRKSVFWQCGSRGRDLETRECKRGGLQRVVVCCGGYGGREVVRIPRTPKRRGEERREEGAVAGGGSDFPLTRHSGGRGFGGSPSLWPGPRARFGLAG